MRASWGILGLVLTQLAYADFDQSESWQLACSGDTYTSTTGEEQTISRFNKRSVVLTFSGDHTDIRYEDGYPVRAVRTESHYRARTSGDTQNWQLIHLEHESLDISVTTFTSLPDQRHRSVRFRGNCQVTDPVT